MSELYPGWPVHLEPKHPPAKKLIINVAPGWLIREQLPSAPYTPEEIADEVKAAYKVGASMWHIHLRNPASGSHRGMSVEERVRLHRQTCDLVLAECPDIITDPSGAQPYDDDSVQARIKPYFEVLVGMNPRYADIAVLNMGTMALGLGKPTLFVNTIPGLIAQGKALEALGIKPEFACYTLGMIEDTKKHFLRVARKPWLIDVLVGLHNTMPGNPRVLEVASDMLHEDGIVWQAICGGRDWLRLASEALMLGADAVRVGKEDSVYWYPDRDDKITSCADVVAKIARIARELGREIASPSEARRTLGLKQT